jgi:inorganic pyrophosphatase
LEVSPVSAAADRGLLETLRLLFKAHPWHGVPIGDQAPSLVTAYIEMVPTETIKYEVDKGSGHLRVDRPQRFSSQCPALYGFIPQTYCGEGVAQLCAEETGRTSLQREGDPLDICVLTERTLSHGDLLVRALPIGGLRTVDRDQVDDKIVAVLAGDAVYARYTDLDQCPPAVVERLKHYFLTYKQDPEVSEPSVELLGTYGRAAARETIARSMADYQERFSLAAALLQRGVLS